MLEKEKSIDAVLISHSHWDHLDYGSLRLVGQSTPLLVPVGMGARLRARGFRQVEELEPGEVTRLGPLWVEATEAAHRGFAPPIGPTDLAIGFVLHGPSTVYFPGDTALFEGITVIFLAQVFGVTLSMGQMVAVMVMAVLTAVGAAGVPGGSIPLLVGVLTMFGVPAEGIAIVLGVDRILDMSRTTVNVSLAYQWKPWLEFSADLMNAFNEPHVFYRAVPDRIL